MYEDVWENRDLRMDGWPMMSSFVVPFLICSTYVLLVTIIGPKFMETRKPYNLANFMYFYNITQVMVSTYVVYETVVCTWHWMGLTQHFLSCQGVPMGDDEFTMRMLRAGFIYHINKYVELWDTVSMVLRKKYNQVTFLHVYHHWLMPIWTYQQCRWLPGSHESLVMPWNSAVHVVMYSYYFLSAVYGSNHPYLWWKRYITLFQLVQFVVLISHSCIYLAGFVMGLDDAITCGHPWQNTVATLIFLYIPFFCLFSKFYIDSYTKPTPKLIKIE